MFHPSRGGGPLSISRLTSRFEGSLHCYADNGQCDAAVGATDCGVICRVRRSVNH